MRTLGKKTKYASHIFNGFQSDEEHKQKERNKNRRMENFYFCTNQQKMKMEKKNGRIRRRNGKNGKSKGIIIQRRHGTAAVEEKFKK